MLIGKKAVDQYLDTGSIQEVVVEGLSSQLLDGKRILFIIPDGTRSMPMPAMFDIINQELLGRVEKLDYLVALGTHQKMNDAQLSKLVGQNVQDGQVGQVHIYNHEWDRSDTFVQIGVLPAAMISEKTNGMLSEDVPIRINKLIFEYDHIIICGPVFPHEVVGFSGGNKYFIPGIAGPEIINFTHWLGALITNYKIIGTPTTPIRAIINEAAAFIRKPVSCISLVVTHKGVAGIFFGTALEAWAAAAELSARTHIIYVDTPFKRVLSVMPRLYDDLWTAAKGMYKMEPVIADGGEVIIFAPHISEVSYTHGKIIDEIGYHCRDYFVKQWDKYKHYPSGVLAHSTHLRGMGEFDPITMIETPRIQVTLATAIPPERCHQIGVGYLNPAIVNLADWENQEQEGILLVPQAGEMLYRLRNPEIQDQFTKKEF